MSAWVEMLRMAQVALLILTLVILGARVNRWWCARWRCLLPAAGTGAIALLICAGSVDALVHARPGGAQTVALTLASVGLLMQALTVGLGGHGRGLGIHPGRRARPSHEH
jgi:hypothetical protein